MNTLTQKDAELFYELWIPLLDFANKKLKVRPHLDELRLGETSSSDFAAVAKSLFENEKIISDYLKKQAGKLPSEHSEIINGWKKHVDGSFIIERSLKSGAVFIHSATGQVYSVKGIISAWEEMLNGLPLPVMIDTTLIPFNDVIISYGLFFVYSIRFGSGYRAELKRIYMDAKKDGGIHKSF